MALQGHLASLALTGTSSAFTNKSCTQVSGQIYAIDDAAREVWDPDVTLSVRMDTGGTPTAVAHSDIESIDLLHGIITFAAAFTVVGTVDVSGNYLPRTTIAKAFQLTINRTRELLPDEKFGDTSRKKIAGLQDASGDMSIRDVADTTVAGGVSLASLFNNGTAFVLSFLPGTGLDTIRARVVFESVSIEGDVAGQVLDNISWTVSRTTSVDGYDMSISTG